MPTYEYECSLCGHAFEIFHSMTEKPLKKCPKCKKSGLQRLIGTGGGIIFKGKGFYANDYKKKESTVKEPSSEPATLPSCAKDCCNKACPANPQNP